MLLVTIPVDTILIVLTKFICAGLLSMLESRFPATTISSYVYAVEACFDLL
jgi:hypothetical protein